MDTKTGLLLTWLIIATINNINVDAGSCRLKRIPETSSKSKSYKLPPVPGNLEASDEPLWKWDYTGILVGIKSSGLHHNYLSSRFSTSSRTYWLHTNSKTKHFLKESKIGEMTKLVTLKCGDNSTTTYHLKIPFRYITPPDFVQDKYIFNIPRNWNRTRPITGTGPIYFISSNPVECELDPRWLTFVAEPDIVRVKAYPLWVHVFPSLYYFRVDLYLQENVILRDGTMTFITLSEVNEFNSRATEIIIRVSTASSTNANSA